MRDHRECEVCRRVRDVVVASSAFIPTSHALCTECLQKPAEPLLVFNYLLDEIGRGDPKRLDPALKNWYTWMDGRYVHWTNFVTLPKDKRRP